MIKNSERGGILPSVLILLFILTLLVFGLEDINFLNQKMSNNFINHTEAFHNAEIAMYSGVCKLQNKTFVLPSLQTTYYYVIKKISEDTCGNAIFSVEGHGISHLTHTIIFSLWKKNNLPPLPHCGDAKNLWDFLLWKQIQ